MRHQLTGNAGLYHVARELSRRGWHVMPTVRNARGADLYAAGGDEEVAIPIQSKALSKKAPVPLGADLETLRTHWWIITVDANTASPTCYVMTLEEVKAGAHRGEKEGRISFWLQPKAYALDAYKEAWDRLGSPENIVKYKPKLREDWYKREISPSIDLSAAGIYQWSIEGIGVYVGRTKVLRRRLPAYGRNVIAMIEGRPWHGDPTKEYRAIHKALREAYDAGTLITATVLESCGPADLAARERHWIGVRREEAARGGLPVLNSN